MQFLHQVRATCLKRSGSGWCQGVLKQYVPGQKLAYVIEWNVDPKVLENVDEQDMDILMHQYKECDKRRLLDIECVGMEIFGQGCRSRLLHVGEDWFAQQSCFTMKRWKSTSYCIEMRQMNGLLLIESMRS